MKKGNYKVSVWYYNWEWYRRKLRLNKTKLVKEKILCRAIDSIGKQRLSFISEGYSTNLDTKQIKKLIIETVNEWHK